MAAVACAMHGIAMLREELTQQCAHISVIVDYEYGFRHRRNIASQPDTLCRLDVTD